MKILVCNWAGSPKVQNAFEKVGVHYEELDLTEQQIATIFSLLVFREKMSVKIIQHRDPEGVVMVVDDEKFRKRNPKFHKKSKNSVMTKEYGTKKYPVEDVLPFIDKRVGMKPIKQDFDGDSIKMNSLRLRTFKHKGCSCVSCGIEGTYFLKVRGNSTESWHFNLYADLDVVTEEGVITKRVLFTKDHIHPKSLGGPDSLANMQTMCESCNSRKGNKIDA